MLGLVSSSVNRAESVSSSVNQAESAVSLYGALVVARQAALEGSHMFPSYPEWFKVLNA